MPGLPPLLNDVPSLPPRPSHIDKHAAGHVAIVAGSRGMSGAAILCGLGALRGGAGLVRVYTPESVQPLVAAAEPCLMTYALPENRSGELSFKASGAAILSTPDWANVAAIGPGLGHNVGLSELVNALFQTFPGPLVLDADALNVAATAGWSAEWWRNRQAADSPMSAPAVKPPVVLTPHVGEMQRLRRALKLSDLELTHDDARLLSACEVARATATIVVLKGHRTVVASAAAAYVNPTGNAGMAAGGMGDVLTGLIAALIAQGMPAFDAARLAVYVHGQAGDRLARQIGPIGFLARELADAIPAALAEATRAPIGFR